jgi:hypothetical protein
MASKTIQVEERELIYRMREQGLTFASISYCLGKSAAACSMIYSRWALIRELPPKEIIKKSKLDGEPGRALIRVVLDNPFAPVSKLPQLLQEALPRLKDIPSDELCRTWLISKGFKRQLMRNKALIHPRNQVKRLMFAEFALSKDVDWWDRIIWSDETTVRSMPAKQKRYSWVATDTPYENVPVNGQVQAGGISVMFWGCMSKLGLGPLIPLQDGNMTAIKYKDMLNKTLLPLLRECERDYDVEMIFMQDNAPCHKANMIMEFLAQKDIETLDWPPQSPDLNPIENVWAWVKSYHIKNYPIPTTKAMLIANILEIWNNKIHIEMVEKYCDSASRRVVECYKAGGKITKY